MHGHFVMQLAVFCCYRVSLPQFMSRIHAIALPHHQMVADILVSFVLRT